MRMQSLSAIPGFIFSLIKARSPSWNPQSFLTCPSYCYPGMPEVLISSLCWVENSWLKAGNTPISNFHFVLIQSASSVPPPESTSVWGPNLVGENGSTKERKIKRDYQNSVLYRSPEDIFPFPSNDLCPTLLLLAWAPITPTTRWLGKGWRERWVRDWKTSATSISKTFIPLQKQFDF